MERSERKKLFNDETISFMHGELPDGRRCTAAMTYDDNMLYMAIAACSKKDNFCRSTGRFKALARLSDFLKGKTDRYVAGMNTEFVFINGTSLAELFEKGPKHMLKAIRKNKQLIFQMVCAPRV